MHHTVMDLVRICICSFVSWLHRNVYYVSGILVFVSLLTCVMYGQYCKHFEQRLPTWYSNGTKSKFKSSIFTNIPNLREQLPRVGNVYVSETNKIKHILLS